MRPALVIVLSAAFPAGADILTTPRPLAQIAALPRLKGDSPVAAMINADLARQDRAVLKDAMDCVAPIDEGGARVLDQTGDYSRTVQVVMYGQAFLSILVTIDAYCPGAAHGFTDVHPLSYDLKTGRPLDLATLLPSAWKDASFLTFGDDTATQAFHSQAMTDYYHAHYPRLGEPDCANVALSNDPCFQFWPDAEKRHLVMWPSESSHATRACDDPVWITPAELAALGGDTGLVAALTAP